MPRERTGHTFENTVVVVVIYIQRQQVVVHKCKTQEYEAHISFLIKNFLVIKFSNLRGERKLRI